MKLRERIDRLGDVLVMLSEVVDGCQKSESAATKLRQVNTELAQLGYEKRDPERASLDTVIRRELEAALQNRGSDNSISIQAIASSAHEVIREGRIEPAGAEVRQAVKMGASPDGTPRGFIREKLSRYMGILNE